MENGKPDLFQVVKLHKSYGDLAVLKSIDLTIKKNESVCILGISGSGKTTLLNILAGLQPPSGGDVLIDGEEFYSNNRDDLRVQNIGMIFQKFELLTHMTALENVMAAHIFQNSNQDEVMRKASRLLDQVGLASHLYKYPYQLSSGQKQRVGIARALINEGRIIIADEPTGSLDSETSSMIMDLLLGFIKQGRSLIYSTHNISIADYAERIYILRNGKLHQVTHDTLNNLEKLKDVYVENIELEF